MRSYIPGLVNLGSNLRSRSGPSKYMQCASCSLASPLFTRSFPLFLFTSTMPFDKSFYPSIHTAPSAGGPLLPWSELKFNPVGLCNLRNRLGLFPKEPGIFTRNQERFLASDIAWFAAGASDDDNHYVRPDTFHPLFNVCRENLPTGRQGNQLWTSFRQNLQQLTFDLVRNFNIALFFPTE
jgi:hypothetical protein